MSKIKIAIASLQQESNTLSPIPTRREDFDQAFGTEMLAKVHITDLLESAGANTVPTLYAHALPGGSVIKEDYLFFADRIVEGIPFDVDGIWLYMHGAMHVEDIGSGETYLLHQIRNKVGFDIPIAVGLDFHANNTDEICELANVICGFRTAPHIDQIETEQRTMRLLLTCIQKRILPRPRIARPYVVVPGDAVQTALPPLNKIMQTAEELEREPGILCAQVFGGQGWVDVPYMGPSMVVTHEQDEEKAQRYADMLAEKYYNARYDFKFHVEAVDVQEAVKRVMAADTQVFITDSGDNTTAGAAGDNAHMLNVLLRAGAKNVLLAGIMDREAVKKCYASNIGDTLTLTVGGSLSDISEKAHITGRLMRRGHILGYADNKNAGRAVTLDCGDITVVITERRTAFTNSAIFASAELDISRYRIVVVKQGYLYPELAKIAPRAIFALTPGSSTVNLADMGHKNIHRPMYPLDDNFM